MPGTTEVSSARRRMISVALALRESRGFRLISIRPVLRVVFAPSIPTKDERLSTSGSFKIVSARADWLRDMAA